MLWCNFGTFPITELWTSLTPTAWKSLSTYAIYATNHAAFTVILPWQNVIAHLVFMFYSRFSQTYLQIATMTLYYFSIFPLNLWWYFNFILFLHNDLLALAPAVFLSPTYLPPPLACFSPAPWYAHTYTCHLPHRGARALSTAWKLMSNVAVPRTQQRYYPVGWGSREA